MTTSLSCRFLDLDIECFTSVEPWLNGSDLILQSETYEGTDVTNALAATVPKHPFWGYVLEVLLTRSAGVVNRDLEESKIGDVSSPQTMALTSRASLLFISCPADR